ncbi:hypothetical protein D3C81_1227520 [compost metagenome]
MTRFFKKCALGCIQLPAAIIAAAALLAISLNGRMSSFSRVTGGPFIDILVNDHPRTNTMTDTDVDQMITICAGPKFLLTLRPGISLVINHCRDLEFLSKPSS